MTVTYTIDLKQRVVFTQVDGVVDSFQLREHQDRLANDPSFESNMCELMDCNGVENAKISTINKSQLAKNSPWGNSARRAIVVPNPLIFGFLRIFQTFMSDTHGEFSIFYNKDSAATWLGIKTINK